MITSLDVDNHSVQPNRGSDLKLPPQTLSGSGSIYRKADRQRSWSETLHRIGFYFHLFDAQSCVLCLLLLFKCNYISAFIFESPLPHMQPLPVQAELRPTVSHHHCYREQI